jgi:hypothetical protein
MYKSRIVEEMNQKLDLLNRKKKLVFFIEEIFSSLLLLVIMFAPTMILFCVLAFIREARNPLTILGSILLQCIFLIIMVALSRK